MKKLNFTLLKAIIKTDFFLLEFQKFKKLKSLELNSNENFNVLNIIELNLYLKQFIRILQFVKKQKINIIVLNSNIQYLFILKNLFAKNKNMIQNLLTVGENSNSILSKTSFFIYINKERKKNDFLTTQINSKVENTNTGVYKIFNNLNSFKKLFFFAVLVQSVLKILKKKNEAAKKI